MKYVAGSPSGTVLPEGEYPFECINAEAKVSSNSGNDMIEVSLKIGKDGPVVRDFLMGGEKTKWKLDNFRAAIGEQVKIREEVDINPDDFVGKTGRCFLYIDEYEGRRKNKVADYVVPLAGPQPSPGKPSSPPAKSSAADWR
jgi:hypothetical protein